MDLSHYGNFLDADLLILLHQVRYELSEQIAGKVGGV
jgi:hypothetical protein